MCQDGRWACAQAPCPAECAVGGDGHHLTLDGRSFFFRGGAGCRSSLVQVRGGLTPERGKGRGGGLARAGALLGLLWNTGDRQETSK